MIWNGMLYADVLALLFSVAILFFACSQDMSREMFDSPFSDYRAKSAILAAAAATCSILNLIAETSL